MASTNDRIKICLLALTGFGNSVLNELLTFGFIQDILVYTRKEKRIFPYYECEELTDFCKYNKIHAYTNQMIGSSDVYKSLQEFKPDMILVATFDQKIPGKIISLPRLGAVNIHPSLLPHYRGPTPTNWAVIHGEKESGVTFHMVNEEFDTGDILFQQKISINGLTDGEVRKKLAGLSAKMLEPFLNSYMKNRIEPIIQIKNQGSYYPKITSKEGVVLLKSGIFDSDNLIRGLTPYPGKEMLS